MQQNPLMNAIYAKNMDGAVPPPPVTANPLSAAPSMGSSQPMGAVQPKAAKPNPLATAFQSFARGFAPEQTREIDDRYKSEAQDKAKKALVWMQQTAAQPLERRAQFTQQYAQQIAADTGQPVEAIMQSAQDPNGFTDEAISQGVAALSAQLGQGPTAPEYQFLQGPDGAISLGDKGTGQVRQVQPGTPKPPSPAKYNYQDMVGPQGPGIYAVNEADPTDARFVGKQIPKADGNGPAPPSGYRWKAGGGLEAIPGGPADKTPGAGMDPDTIKLEREYAKDWKGVYTNFADIKGQYNRMQALGDRKDAASDLALIVSFTKMLDPGSVAREGEVQLTQKAASLMDNASIWLERIQKGETLLPPNVRQQYLEAAQEMYGVYNNAYNQLADSYYKTAQSYGYDPSRVMMGYDAEGRARNDAVKSASGNPWPTIRAGLPDNYSDLDPETAGMIDAAFADGDPNDVTDLLEKYK